MSALGHAIRQTQTLTGRPVTVIGGLAVLARLPDDPTARLFVRAHAWAAATATPVIISARGQPDVEAAVSEVAPLIAMKLQATFDRGSACSRAFGLNTWG